MNQGVGGARPQLAQEISAYWDGRAQSYSNGVNGELGDARKEAWRMELASLSGELLAAARAAGEVPRACDLGCGPGFFAILLAEMGFAVDAVDASAAMLERARRNFARTAAGEASGEASAPAGEAACAAAQGSAAFHLGDLLQLPFPDASFDLCAARNVTWLMREPERAYAEWLRVLKPGGKLVVFDANWYRYLVDPEVAAMRAADQEGNVLEGWDEDAQATSDEERRCEELALALPLTPVLRPKWDLRALAGLGAAACRADEGAWKRVWSDSEQRYYAATPLFLVEAVKA